MIGCCFDYTELLNISILIPFADLLDGRGRCRWSTNPGEQVLFVKHSRNQLYILDVEKQVLTLKEPIDLDSGIAVL